MKKGKPAIGGTPGKHIANAWLERFNEDRNKVIASMSINIDTLMTEMSALRTENQALQKSVLAMVRVLSEVRREVTDENG